MPIPGGDVAPAVLRQHAKSGGPEYAAEDDGDDGWGRANAMAAPKAPQVVGDQEHADYVLKPSLT